ncbi:hypothetical protein BOX15_Mlig000552g1 [Macrostomum lignano]|uniref:CABIT domain-containing protein n=1 Tax=Macrostomum lignano TaxID=282301 RepID=A0A267H4W1_9PLAT|nr:hypothetical protein BOX15_Mlig000552g1 [Macrostomum lignano]
MSELNLFSLLWRRDTQSLQELLDCYELAESNRSILISIRCLREQCTCALNNQEVLMLKAVRNCKLVAGSWSKTKSTPSMPHHALSKQSASSSSTSGNEKSIRVILTDYSTGWFEVLNESGGSIPYWTSVKDVARHKPQSVFLRKDQKCLFAKNKAGNGNFDLSAESTGLLKSGTVLNYIESGKFRVQKHRKVKELPLVKCSDTNGHLVFLNLEDKCAVSPVAGAENISGVHTLQSLLSKFQFPLSVRPVFGPPLPWLSFSDRHSLRLTSCNRGDLLFLASLSNPERFFVVTPEMLNQHAFRVGESELGHHVQLLERHSTRVTQFLQSYHPFEALRYLIRHLGDATNQLAPQERCLLQPGDQQVLPLAQQQEQQPLEVDDLLDEVEDIYFYVRTGRMPAHSHFQQQQKLQQQQQFQQHSKSNSSNDSGLVLVNPPRIRLAECMGVPAAPRPFRATSCDDLLEAGREKRRQQQEVPQQQQLYQQPHQMTQQQQPQQQQQQQQQPQQQQYRPRQGPPPPLPPRKYSNSPAAHIRHDSRLQQQYSNGIGAARHVAMVTCNGNGVSMASSVGSNLHGSRSSMHAMQFSGGASSAAMGAAAAPSGSNLSGDFL